MSGGDGTAFVRTDRVLGRDVVVVKGRPRPRPRRLDRTLWPAVAKRSLHVSLLACLVVPLLVVGMWVPDSPGWLAIYAGHCTVVGVVVIVVERSHDRWLEFLDYLRRGPGPR